MITKSAEEPILLGRKQTKGAGSRKAGLVMAFKLMERAEKRWRKLNASHLVAVAHLGIKFSDGKAELLLPATTTATEEISTR